MTEATTSRTIDANFMSGYLGLRFTYCKARSDDLAVNDVTLGEDGGFFGGDKRRIARWASQGRIREPRATIKITAAIAPSEWAPDIELSRCLQPPSRNACRPRQRPTPIAHGCHGRQVDHAGTEAVLCCDPDRLFSTD